MRTGALRPARALSPALLLLLPGLLLAEEGSKEGSKSPYEGRLTLSLLISPEASLVGVRDLAVDVAGAPVRSVRFYVDGELAATDELPPFETRYDFGPTARKRELLVVAFTPEGSKNKRIFVTDAAALLDASQVKVGKGSAPAPAPASGAGPALPGAPGTPRRSGERGVAGNLSVVILEPWGDVVSGVKEIVADARAMEPERISRVELFVDGAKIATVEKPPYRASFDFGPDPRPREVRAVAYGLKGDAASAVWRSEGAAPAAAPASSSGQRLAVSFSTPKEGDYLAGPVTLAAEVRPASGAPVTRVDFFVDGSLVGTASKEPWQITWDAGSRVLAHDLKLFAYDSNGGRAEARVKTRPLDVTIETAVREVVLTASFTDGKGRLLTDVTQEEVAVEEDGDRQTITTFQEEKRPLLIALVVDASGSMKDKLLETKRAAMSFVDQLLPEDRALVISFSATSRVLCEATSDHALLHKAIEGIELQDSTALYDAISVAVDRLAAAGGSAGDVRKALVLLSDGEDSGKGHGGSAITYEEAEKKTLLSDVRGYTIDITTSITAALPKIAGGPTFSRGQSPRLQGFADQTGGAAYFVSSLSELKDTYAQVAEELRRQYLISYRPENEKRDGKWRDVAIKSVGSRKIYAKTRAGYYSDPRR